MRKMEVITMFNANCLVRFFFASFPEKAGNIWKLFYNFALKIHLRDLSSPMTCREKLNKANAAKRMADFLGHSKDLITLSLSQALAYKRGSYIFYFTRGLPASIYGFSWYKPREVGLFLSPVGTTAAGPGAGSSLGFCRRPPLPYRGGAGGGVSNSIEPYIIN